MRHGICQPEVLRTQRKLTFQITNELEKRINSPASPRMTDRVFVSQGNIRALRYCFQGKLKGNWKVTCTK